MRRFSPAAISIGALCCGLAAVALGTFLLLTGDGASRPAEAPTAAPTATPTEATPEPASERYPSIRVVGDLPFPDDLAMLDTTGAYGHGTGLPSRTRIIVGGSAGPVVIPQVEPGADDSQLMGIFSDESGALLAAVCSAPAALPKAR